VGSCKRGGGNGQLCKRKLGETKYFQTSRKAQLRNLGCWPERGDVKLSVVVWGKGNLENYEHKTTNGDKHSLEISRGGVFPWVCTSVQGGEKRFVAKGRVVWAAPRRSWTLRSGHIRWLLCKTRGRKNDEEGECFQKKKIELMRDIQDNHCCWGFQYVWILGGGGPSAKSQERNQGVRCVLLK